MTKVREDSSQHLRAPLSVTSAEEAAFSVGIATLQEWRTVEEWGNAEGWNVGHQDASCFHGIDPQGFFVGRLGNRLVSAVSLVNHSDKYAFWGSYVVNPEFRGQGYGRKTCKAAKSHSGRRVVGSDAMPDLVSGYSRSGASPAHETVHYVGRPERATHAPAGVVPIGPDHLNAIAEYDSGCFPAYRRDFLARWLWADGHIARTRLVNGRIAGYGVIRPAPVGHRIGPLFADTPQDAEALFDALIAHVQPDEEVSLYMPDLTGSASTFFNDRGLTEQFRVVRMYEGGTPRIRADHVFAVTSLEVG
ncbi:GNAT family N-acetyltransferase [Streptomyces luteireticuli]|uniref:GNAT family N-acetyltransferase n=1 Tax=Streptomyces luteireticuli TaxID=173858 RepID=A0ABN0YAT4_9ACTN